MTTAPSKSNVDRFINSLRSTCSAGSLSLRHSFAVQACIAHKPSDDDDDDDDGDDGFSGRQVVAGKLLTLPQMLGTFLVPLVGPHICDPLPSLVFVGVFLVPRVHIFVILFFPYQTKPIKANLQNQIYQTEPIKPNLPNLPNQAKPTKQNRTNLQSVFFYWFRPKSSKCWGWQNPY